MRKSFICLAVLSTMTAGIGHAQTLGSQAMVGLQLCVAAERGASEKMLSQIGARSGFRRELRGGTPVWAYGDNNGEANFVQVNPEALSTMPFCMVAVGNDLRGDERQGVIARTEGILARTGFAADGNEDVAARTSLLENRAHNERFWKSPRGDEAGIIVAESGLVIWLHLAPKPPAKAN